MAAAGKGFQRVASKDYVRMLGVLPFSLPPIHAQDPERYEAEAAAHPTVATEQSIVWH